jgi:UDPglucose 6-dehydrogenase
MSARVTAPRKVAVIGLGKLGAPMAAAVASRGIQVIGADLDSAKVEAINRGEAPVRETDLAERIRAGRARLRATTDIRQAALEAEVTFIIVPTPSEPDGGFSLRHVLPALDAAGQAIAASGERRTVVITCTVMPGHTGGPIRERLEAISGKKAGADFGLCYSPEFIALGSVIHDFLNPDLILVGESDARTGDLLEAFYRKVCENKPVIARMNFVNAELSKLSVNTYVTTKITFANMLAHLCEQIPGADVDVVTHAIGHDTRIGHKYLKGAAGYGGPCFPRDNLALGRLARDHESTAALAEATDRANRSEAVRLMQLVRAHARPEERVGILGLSYKPDTDVIEESQGVMLAEALLREGTPIVVYDPMALESARAVLGDRAAYAGSAADCLRQSKVAVLVTPWKEFGDLRAADLGSHAAQLTLIDAWRQVAPELRAALGSYIAIGIGSH